MSSRVVRDINLEVTLTALSSLLVSRSSERRPYACSVPIDEARCAASWCIGMGNIDCID